MIQKPNTTLATKNIGRWMGLSTSARNEKMKMQNEVPFPEPVAAIQVMVSGKSLTKSVKDLHGHSNPIVDSNE